MNKRDKNRDSNRDTQGDENDRKAKTGAAEEGDKGVDTEAGVEGEADKSHPEIPQPEPPDAARITEALADAGARKPTVPGPTPGIPPAQVRDSSHFRRG